MVDSKIFVCATAAETKTWMENIEDRRYKSLRQQLSPSHSALSYLVDLIQSFGLEIYVLYKMYCHFVQINIGYFCTKKELYHSSYILSLSRCHVMKTGRGRSLKGTYCGLPSCNGRGCLFSTWAIRDTFHWCTSATYAYR